MTTENDDGTKILNHTPLVHSIARKYYRRYGLSYEDLVAEGFLGLTIAKRRYNPKKNVPFGSYAKYWVLAYIRKYILDNWSIVKIGNSADQRKLFFRLRQTINAIKDSDHSAGESEDEINALAADILDTPKKLTKAMSMRLQANDAPSEILDYLPAKLPNPEEILEQTTHYSHRVQQLITAVLNTCTERECKHFLLRFRPTFAGDKPQRLADIAKQTGYSISTVQQDCKSCAGKIRHLVDI